MQKYKHAVAKLPNYTESMSLQYNGWATLKFRRSKYKGNKYDKSTPMSVLRYALVEDRNAKGWNKDHMMAKIDKKIDLAKNDSGHLQDIINYLNKENDDVEYGADTQNRDYQLRNIVNFCEDKGKRLDSVSPEIVDHISTFENLNNLDKRLDIEEIHPSDVQVHLHGKIKRKTWNEMKKAKQSIKDQFGHKSNGQVNLLMKQTARDCRSQLKANIKEKIATNILHNHKFNVDKMVKRHQR